MSGEFRAGRYDARRTTRARLLEGFRYGDWCYGVGFAFGCFARKVPA